MTDSDSIRAQATVLMDEIASRSDLAPLSRGWSREELESRIAAGLTDPEGAEDDLRALGRACARRGVGISALHQLSRSLDALGVRREVVSRALEVCAVEYSRTLSSERELRFSRLDESGIMGVFVAGLKGDVLEANEAFANLVGYSREELVSGVGWAALTPPEWRAADEVALRQLGASGTARPYEKEYLRKNGTRVSVQLGAAMLDQTTFIAFATDISARRRLEQVQRDALELETQNRRIEQVNRRKNEFLANMSHDLRTPLNAVIGFAELLNDGETGPLLPDQKDFVAAILAGGRNLLRLINDLLDLVRVEAGKLRIAPEPVELTALFGLLTEEVRESATRKGIGLVAEVDPAVREGIVLDPARLKQVLHSYLSNAIKFTPEGGQIAVRALPEGSDELRILVQDSGVGIAPEHIQSLFLDLQEPTEGVHVSPGLGLVLTRRLVEAQGGRVEAQSIPLSGSSFAAVLPRVAAAARKPTRRSPNFAGTSVLVIEDDAQDRMTLVETLEQAGYAVQAAALGEEALALCMERRFDAITLDLLLPDVSGIEILSRIRSAGPNRETPVLVVSVAADSAVGFAVSDVLPKPASPKALLTSLCAAGVRPREPGDVMVVDDDPDSLLLMSAALNQVGYRAVCYSDGETGLRAAAQAPPAAVVLDLLMPGIDGFQFLERLRAQPATQKTPVLVWTSKDLTAEDRARLKRSAHGVVPKGQAGAQALLEDLRRFTLVEGSP
jgi:PAS domain S-box-containing protein